MDDTTTSYGNGNSNSNSDRTPELVDEDATLVEGSSMGESAGYSSLAMHSSGPPSSVSPSSTPASSTASSPYLNGIGNGNADTPTKYTTITMSSLNSIGKDNHVDVDDDISLSKKKRPPTGLSVDATKRLPQSSAPAGASLAYPVPESLSQTVHQSSRALSQRLRLFLGLASQTVINVLPSTPTTARPPSPIHANKLFLRRSSPSHPNNTNNASLYPPAAASSSSSNSNSSSSRGSTSASASANFNSKNGAIPTSSQSTTTSSGGSRLLTGGSIYRNAHGSGKAKDRAETDEAAPPAWLEFVKTVRGLIPSSSGPKRVRTRTRRYLIFLACISLLCYVFSNTLREAYYSAAVFRRQQILDEMEKQRLGPHLTEIKRHPIDELMENAKIEWEGKVARQSKTPEEAIEEYKRRYKRDPPDGFTEWFNYAKGKVHYLEHAVTKWTC